MPLTAAQRSAATYKAWIKRRLYAAMRQQGQMPPPRKRTKPAVFSACLCGCGAQLPGRRRRYANRSHRPKPKPKPRPVKSPFQLATSPVMLLFKSLALAEQAIGKELFATRPKGPDGKIILTDEQRTKYDRYQKLKAVAMGGLKTTSPEMQNEAKLALRKAVEQMQEVVKLVF